MKRFLVSLAVLLFTTGAFAQLDPLVTVREGSLTINKAKVTPSWKIGPVISGLGSNGRTRNGFNTTHTYDDRGFVLFEKNKEDKSPSGTLSEAQFYFGELDSNGVVPRDAYFTGTLMIDGVKMNKGFTSARLMDELSQYDKTESYTEHNYRMAYKGLYIYFLFNEVENRLLKVSIGPDKTK